MRPDPDQPTADPQPNRWEQRGDETDRAYAVFCVYRDLGPLRTLRRAAANFYHQHPELTESDRLDALTMPQLAQAKEWSRHNEWVDRASAWDHHLDDVSRAEQELAAREMRAGYRTLAAELRGRVGTSLQVWAEQGREFSPMEALKALEVAQKIEAWALEMPSEIRTVKEPDADARELAEAGRELVAGLRLVNE